MSGRDWLAGLVGGADRLGASLNRRKDMREANALRKAEREAAQADALALIAARAKADPPPVPAKRQPVTVWAGDNLLQFDDATGEWAPAMLRSGAAPVPSGHADDDAIHGAPADAGMGALVGAPSPLPRQAISRPAEVKPTPRESLLPVVENGKVVYKPLSQAVGMEAPRTTSTPNLVTGVDPVTGKNVRVVDAPGVQMPTTGDKPVKAGFDALPPAQQNEVRTKQTALLNMQKAVKALQDAVNDGGLALRPGEYQSTIRALQADAMIQFKEAANLGALSGPDMGLVENALGSATNPLQLLKGGKDGVLKALETAQGSLRNRARTMEEVYGVAMPPGFYGKEPPKVYSPDNPFAKPPV